MRKGVAFIASCIGALLTLIKYMGGWATSIDVIEGKYIDPAIAPSLDA
jgi:hypothetical protein